MMTQYYHQGVQANYKYHFLYIYIHYYVYITLLFWSKKWKCMPVDQIKFGQAQTSVPKIGIPMLKTASINPC